jgi:quinolinate synthase
LNPKQQSQSPEVDGGLVIMAHHYQADAVVRQAHHVGDSLELARRIPEITAKNILFCGVFFMAESAAIIASPDQHVYIPAPDAKCVMSEMAPAPLVETVLHRLGDEGAKVIPLTYVNSSAAVKAICGRHGGSVCTSANAQKMLTWAMEQGDAVLFLPDKNLAMNTANTLGIAQEQRLILDIRRSGGLVSPRVALKHKLLVWPGCCAIHFGFRTTQIHAARERHPGATVVVHPECPPEVVEAADSVGSTSHIIRYTAEAKPGAVIYIGTEINLVQRLAQQYAGQKTILPLTELACSNMAKGTVDKLEALVAGLAKNAPSVPRVTVPEDVATHARVALERMLAVSA